MRNEVYVYECQTYDGRSWPLTQGYYDYLKKKLEANTRLLEMPDGSLIALTNIKGMPRRQLTMADTDNGLRRLPQGEVKFDPNGPGYKKFLEAWKKYNPKGYSQHLRRLAERVENEKSSDNK